MAPKSVAEIIKQVVADGSGAVEAFKRDLNKVRTGRASAGLVENVQVEHYGSRMALSHLAQITTPESHLIVIQPYDAGAGSAIEKAIQSAGLGLNPSKEGAVIRVMVPPLTEDRRRDIVKQLHKLAEEFRVSIRAHRREANEAIKALEKDGLSKDESKRAADSIQKQIDDQIAKLDTLLAAKEKEVMTV